VGTPILLVPTVGGWSAVVTGGTCPGRGGVGEGGVRPARAKWAGDAGKVRLDGWTAKQISNLRDCADKPYFSRGLNWTGRKFCLFLFLIQIHGITCIGWKWIYPGTPWKNNMVENICDMNSVFNWSKMDGFYPRCKIANTLSILEDIVDHIYNSLHYYFCLFRVHTWAFYSGKWYVVLLITWLQRDKMVMDQLRSNHRTDIRIATVMGRFINQKENHILKMVESIPKPIDNMGPAKE
jgi:hypothetical protein